MLAAAVVLAAPARTSSEPVATDAAAVQRVFGSAPPMSLMVHVLDSGKLVAVNMPARNSANNGEARFLGQRFLSLPVLGGWHGDRRPNLEEILLVRPDLIVFWDTALINEFAQADLNRIDRPVVRLNIDRTDNYPEAFRRLGRALGCNERAERLAAYIEEELRQLQAFLATIPENKRVRVYYAEDRDGLRSDCDRSFHAEPIGFAGGDNVLKCVQNTVMGMQSVNFEQLLNLDPEVIVAQDAAFLQTIQNDGKWQHLRAVRDRRVVLVPKTPCNWLDRPPSFMRVLGTHWLARTFYPDRYPYDLRHKTRAFFALFFGVELTDAELTAFFPFL